MRVPKTRALPLGYAPLFLLSSVVKSEFCIIKIIATPVAIAFMDGSRDLQAKSTSLGASRDEKYIIMGGKCPPKGGRWPTKLRRPIGSASVGFNPLTSQSQSLISRTSCYLCLAVAVHGLEGQDQLQGFGCDHDLAVVRLFCGDEFLQRLAAEKHDLGQDELGPSHQLAEQLERHRQRKYRVHPGEHQIDVAFRRWKVERCQDHDDEHEVRAAPRMYPGTALDLCRIVQVFILLECVNSLVLSAVICPNPARHPLTDRPECYRQVEKLRQSVHQ